MIQGMMMSAFQTRVTRDWINYRTLCIRRMSYMHVAGVYIWLSLECSLRPHHYHDCFGMRRSTLVTHTTYSNLAVPPDIVQGPDK